MKAVSHATDKRLDLYLPEIGLSIRTCGFLEGRGVYTVGQLLERTQDQLLEIPYFGPKQLAEVYRALKGIGFEREKKRADGQK